jgi:hypothetical protein
MNPMPTNLHTNQPLDVTHEPVVADGPNARPSVPANDYPGTHADDSTLKNPKTPESSGSTRAERAADKAAHKAAKRQQEADKSNPIISK